MSFFTSMIEQRISDDNQLIKLNKIIDWEMIRKKLSRVYPDRINPISGVKPYSSLNMFKVLLLQNWHSLSDADLEEALKVRFDFMIFAGFEIEDCIPDATTICRFRNKMIELNLDKELFLEVNRQLENHGLKIKSSHGAVVDATVITSAARPNKQIEVIAKDRQEEKTAEINYNISSSKDCDAKWLKKGNELYYGYKMFVATDIEGFLKHLSITSANRNEAAYFQDFVKDIPITKGDRLYADKGYTSSMNRKILKEMKLKDGIMEKATKGKKLSFTQRLKNKLISKKRFIVEQGFGTLKRRFNFFRAKYLTRRKVECQAFFKAICFNMLKAARKVKINHQIAF